ncbi:metallophosphoesterase [Nocardioides marmoribigeumensis]|uniref:3',5'-cyclic AMP phosphodiesterase CpdA n=1 Tax=Nocardioides marmoribigeumensis TaxID=433649 RepID=A0ABU2C161_9ACTN|nr:metallophosphoesterase [Nocardioides marmoribigeumensis]MDR7364355.1 3',5'-cyclic AMP phosphodiesterase CpdA [Nocardioides marmoribigeumensis]
MARLVVAHLSDTHFGVPGAARRVRLALDHLHGMSPVPGLLVVSGDVTDHGLPEEYAEARAVLDTWSGVLAVCPGNHDVRAAYVEAFGPTETVVTHSGRRFVLLDSLVDAVDGVRTDPGHLAEGSLAWLEERLTEDDSPTFVVLHHPPADLGLGLMDPIKLDNGPALATVVARHPHVVATLVGHAHTMGSASFAGRPLLVGGGCVSTVTHDAEALPVLWMDAPVSLALHLHADDGSLVTHWRALPA